MEYDRFFNDTMCGLIQAIEIEKGNIPLTERKRNGCTDILCRGGRECEI